MARFSGSNGSAQDVEIARIIAGEITLDPFGDVNKVAQ